MKLRVLLSGLVAAGAIVALDAPASADCAGPQIRFSPAVVAPGEVVTVIGTGMGTQCYDTGPPPSGEGVLGPPQRKVEILLRQGTRDVRVGTVDADDRYSFSLRVRVPEGLSPGQASLLARLRDGTEVGRFAVPQGIEALTITDTPPTSSNTRPKAEKPESGSQAEAALGHEDDDASAAPWVVAAVLVGSLLVAAAAGLRRARR